MVEDDSRLPRRPDHGPVRRPTRNEADSGVPDLEAQAPVPGDVALRHGLEVAGLPHLVGEGEDRLEEPRADAEPACRRVYADHLEVLVRLGGMQPGQTVHQPHEPER